MMTSSISFLSHPLTSSSLPTPFILHGCIISPPPCAHLVKLSSTIISLRPTLVVNSNEPKREAAAAFLDENGVVVEDMDGYLNNLSLEYDSVWDTKPSWCQPWTIGLTGVVAVAISWLILRSMVVTTLVSSLICAWWYIFLYSYPKAYSDMIAERRKQVIDGVEDTFGLKKPQ